LLLFIWIWRILFESFSSKWEKLSIIGIRRRSRYPNPRFRLESITLRLVYIYLCRIPVIDSLYLKRENTKTRKHDCEDANTRWQKYEVTKTQKHELRSYDDENTKLRKHDAENAKLRWRKRENTMTIMRNNFVIIFSSSYFRDFALSYLRAFEFLPSGVHA
jgi:hypothetical protein